MIAIPKGAHEEITAEDLETSGMEVRPGDLVAINTGWHHRYAGPATDPERARTYLEKGPGLCANSARWLVDHGARTVLIDTPALDSSLHMPYGDGTLESHRVLFAETSPALRASPASSTS